jgi:hypothetical protein
VNVDLTIDGDDDCIEDAEDDFMLISSVLAGLNDEFMSIEYFGC